MDADKKETEHPHDDVDGERKYWLDNPRNVDMVWYILLAICAVLVLLDFVVPKPHLHFKAWEKLPIFYGVFGFVTFICIVLAGKYLRKLIMREEDYYDR